MQLMAIPGKSGQEGEVADFVEKRLPRQVRRPPCSNETLPISKRRFVARPAT